MNFLSPASLWALAALALPLAIHLWRRPPRTVRLGSLRFLQGHAQPLRDLRWRERALLLARLGLLTLLALLLARPMWQPTPSTRPANWVLLDHAAAPVGPSLERLHAMQAAGAETRLLAPGFPAIRSPPADASAAAPDLWSLLREADAVLPPGSSLAVFSPGRLASLRGIRPTLTHISIEWIETASAPVPSRPTTPHPPVRPLNILILHDADRAEDARYVAAALQAVSQSGRCPLAISVAPATAPAHWADWIFWFSAQPVPPAVARDAANVLNDAASPELPAVTPGWIVPQPGTPLFGPPVRLWRRAPAIPGSVFWTDGFGQPLLTHTTDSRHAQWHFASRFGPAWNDLPLGTALPAALRALLADALPTDPADHRAADPAQCLPSDTSAASATGTVLPGVATELRPPLWWLLAVLFCLERWLAHRRPLRLVSPVPAAAPPILSR